MMGRINTCVSFRDKLAYCLEDKLTPDGNVLYKDRAEILGFNRCYGNKEELIRQFTEVQALEPNMSKPVMHISLSFPTGEKLAKSALLDLADDCARFIGFDKNQYITILHKDTRQQHIHLLANRIGFDGRTVSDSYSHGHLADFCRVAERRHHLRHEPGPRRYQTPEQRLVPRQGIRLDKLRKDIGEALAVSADFNVFKEGMEERGYTIYKGRGIAFMDEKRVVIKGCEAGYSLKTINEKLAEGLRLRQEQAQKLLEEQKLQLERQQRQEQERYHRQRQHRLRL